MGYRIETKFGRDNGKRFATPNTFFRFVYFKFHIRSVNTCPRLLLKKGAKVRLAVVQRFAQLVQGKGVVNFAFQITHDFVLQIGRICDVGQEVLWISLFARVFAYEIDKEQFQLIF